MPRPGAKLTSNPQKKCKLALRGLQRRKAPCADSCATPGAAGRAARLASPMGQRSGTSRCALLPPLPALLEQHGRPLLCVLPGQVLVLRVPLRPSCWCWCCMSVLLVLQPRAGRHARCRCLNDGCCTRHKGERCNHHLDSPGQRERQAIQQRCVRGQWAGPVQEGKRRQAWLRSTSCDSPAQSGGA
jgi:hypothetical protein